MRRRLRGACRVAPPSRTILRRRRPASASRRTRLQSSATQSRVGPQSPLRAGLSAPGRARTRASTHSKRSESQTQICHDSSPLGLWRSLGLSESPPFLCNLHRSTACAPHRIGARSLARASACFVPMTPRRRSRRTATKSAQLAARVASNLPAGPTAHGAQGRNDRGQYPQRRT